MGNTNIVYVDYIDSYLDILNSSFPKSFRRIVYNILNYFGYVKVSENYLVLMSVEDGNINKRMINNLIKKLKFANVKNIVLAENFMKNSEVFRELKKEFNILDGRWLYKFLILDIIEKISFIQNKKMDEYEITILCNNPTDIDFENINMLSKKCKILNILTIKNIEKFAYIERKLYEEYGFLLNISTNIEKVCLYSDIIVNIDFSKKDLESCFFKDKSILVQCTKERFEKNFKAVITFYRLNFKKTYISFFYKMKHFEEEILYESLLYYGISLDGMRKFFERDDVKIRSFDGLHGKINFKEFRI